MKFLISDSVLFCLQRNSAFLIACNIFAGGGIVLGSVFSLLFFKRRRWPVILGAGFGTGMAWSNCEKEINAVLQLPAGGSSK